MTLTPRTIGSSGAAVNDPDAPIRQSRLYAEGIEASGENPVAVFQVSYPGPFTRHDVVVNGWSVPHLHAQPCGPNDENVMLILDSRLAITVSVEEAERFVPFLADAIAVALGYTSHPNEDTEQPVRLPQPRPVRMHGIASLAGPAA